MTASLAYADADRDMVHATGKYCAHLSLSDVERQKHRSVNRTTVYSNLQTRASDRFILFKRACEHLHFARRRGYNLCLQFILEQVTRQACDYDTVYHSNVDMQDGLYKSAVQQSVHFLFIILTLRLNYLHLDNMPADLQ